MNYKRLSTLLLWIALGIFALTACKPITDEPQDRLPKGWGVYGEPSPQDYILRLDTGVKHTGKASGHIKFNGDKSDSFATMMQMFKADAYRGKRLRLSVWMKSQEADSLQLWMRLDSEKSMLGFDNMENRPVKGTTDWAKYDITLDVPEETINIAFGVFVVGKGQAWMDDYRFEVVGTEVATTNMLTPEEMQEEQDMGPVKEYPDQPSNLDFEE